MQFGKAIGEKNEPRTSDDGPTDAKQKQPPAVDPVALGPVHDVEPPDEIEEAPGVAPRRKNRAG